MSNHIDEIGLFELKQIMEEEFGDLLNTFVLDAREKIDDMKSSCQSQDIDSLKKIAHSLKGSSAGVCAPGLSSLAKEVEILANAGEFENIEAYLPNLDKEFNAVKQAFSQYS